MVPQVFAELYSKLMASQFAFMQRGEHHLRDVYRAVQDRYPDLCDDSVRCNQICEDGTDTPEWQHRVRGALQSLKSSHGPIMKRDRHGFWIFNTVEAIFPDEVAVGTTFWEGAVRQVTVNAYERNAEARKACIEHYGPRCQICGIDFGEYYGPNMKGFIHVHHVRPLSEIGVEYAVDPVEDLRPVCPNCHAVIHSRSPAYDLKYVGDMLKG